MGATNSVTFHDARLIDSENAISASSQKMLVNGMATEIQQAPPSFLAFQNAQPPSFSPPEGYVWASSYTLSNTSNQDVRLEFITEPDNQNEFKTVMANNPTSIEFSDNRFGVCLSATSGDGTPIIPIDCKAEFIQPVTLKNESYDYQDDNILCVAIRITDLDQNTVIRDFTIERRLSDFKASNAYHVPNVYALSVPNNITSQYYALSEFLYDIQRSIGDYLSIDRYEKIIKQATTVKQGFFGISAAYSGLIYGQENTIQLKELAYETGAVLNTFGGIFSFTPQDINDARTQIYSHFEPLLEAAGYTVSYYNVSSGFIAEWGFRLEKTTSIDIYFALNTADGTNVRWDAGWNDWDSNDGYFMETDCIGPIVTEEQFKDQFSIVLNPQDGSEYVPNNLMGQVKGSTRIEIMSYEHANQLKPENGVDWIDRNNNGQRIVIDSCYYRMAQEM